MCWCFFPRLRPSNPRCDAVMAAFGADHPRSSTEFGPGPGLCIRSAVFAWPHKKKRMAHSESVKTVIFQMTLQTDKAPDVAADAAAAFAVRQTNHPDYPAAKRMRSTRMRMVRSCAASSIQFLATFPPTPVGGSGTCIIQPTDNDLSRHTRICLVLKEVRERDAGNARGLLARPAVKWDTRIFDIQLTGDPSPSVLLGHT